MVSGRRRSLTYAICFLRTSDVQNPSGQNALPHPDGFCFRIVPGVPCSYWRSFDPNLPIPKRVAGLLHQRTAPGMVSRDRTASLQHQHQHQHHRELEDQSGGTESSSDDAPPATSYSIMNNIFRVDSRYSALKAIGKGSFGFVCSAQDEKQVRAVWAADSFLELTRVVAVFEHFIWGQNCDFQD